MRNAQIEGNVLKERGDAVREERTIRVRPPHMKISHEQFRQVALSAKKEDMAHPTEVKYPDIIHKALQSKHRF